jgi:hypothetical protein
MEAAMNTRRFDSMARHATALSRRGSRRVLGGAALVGAITAPRIVSAGKAGKKAQKRCKRQRGQCLAYVEEYCEPKIGSDICKEVFNPCCEHFAGCNAGQGIECLFSKLLGDGGG